MARTLMMASEVGTQTLVAGDIFMLGSTRLNTDHFQNEGEAGRQIEIDVPGHFCFLGGETPDLGNGQHIILRKAAAAGNQDAALVNGWAQTADSDIAELGDLISFGVTTGVGGTGAATVRCIFSADDNKTATYYVSDIRQAPVFGTQDHWSIAGDAYGGGGLAESEAQTKFSVTGVAANFSVYIPINPLSTASTVALRINGVTANSVITIPALSTGLFKVASGITDTIHDGDLVSIEANWGAFGSGGNIYIHHASFSYTATTGRSIDLFGTTSLRIAGDTGTLYLPIGGYGRTGVGLEQFATVRVGFPATLHRLRCQVTGNARVSETVMTLRVNGVDSAVTLTIPAATNGWFETASGLTAVIGKDDDVSLKVVTAAPAASFGISNYGIQITDNGGGDRCNPPIQSFFTFSELIDTSFHDWVTQADIEEEDAADFESFFTTYYHIQDDTMFWMYAPYVYTYLENSSRNDDTPACSLQPRWDWAETISSKKFEETKELYQYKKASFVVDSKHKVRGKGRALNLKYFSETGKDFNVLGWTVKDNKLSGP